jgi:uncharacterized membrane protein
VDTVHTFERFTPFWAASPSARSAQSDNGSLQTLRTSGPGGSGRIAAIDAARGCAMVLVCVSHVKQHLVDSAPTLYWFLMTVTRVATPTFLLLSGFVIGYLLRRESRARVGITLVDRGLFLLLVAHALMGISKLAWHDGVTSWLFERLEITDVIGLALLVAVLVRSARPEILIGWGAALCLLSWPAAMLLEPGSATARMFLVPLFHVRSAAAASIEAPIVAYVGVFLIGMGLSGRLHGALVAGAARDVARPLLKAGAISVALALLGVLLWHSGKGLLPDVLRMPPLVDFVRGALDPRWKLPPSPAYLLFYGGCGLLLTSWLLNGRPAFLVSPITRFAAVIGRASLMCFVVQDILFFGIPMALGLDSIGSVPFWFAYLAVGLVLLYALARRWDEAGGNRFLTVGLKWMASLRRPAPSG